MINKDDNTTRTEEDGYLITRDWEGKEIHKEKILAKGKEAIEAYKNNVFMSVKYYLENEKTGDRSFVW